MIEDYADFEIIEMLKPSSTKVRQLTLRCIASINSEGYYQEDIILTYPRKIDTPSKLSLHISSFVLSPWFESLKYVEPEITECPMCPGVPLQNGECMVCGFKDVV